MTRRLAVARQENELGKFLVQQENQRAELQDKIAKLKQGGTTKEIDEATAAAERLHAQEQAALLQERVKKISENALKPLQDAVKAVKDKVSVEERTKELLAKGIGPERAKAIIAIEKENYELAANLRDKIILFSNLKQSTINNMSKNCRKFIVEKYSDKKIINK